jgi:hypothetical protein
LEAGVLALIAIILLCIAQFTYSSLQQDGYYHIRFGQLLREKGIDREFPWARHTDLNKRFADLYLFYHVLLVPFSFGNLILTAKVSAVLFATLATLLVYWFLSYHRIDHAFFWSLLFLFGSNSLLIRFLAVRPISLAVIFFIVAIHLMIQKKFPWLILVGYLFVLTYTAFPILLVIVLVYTVSYLVYYGKLELKALLYTLAGIVLGIVVNPYFPNNLNLLYVQVVKIGFFEHGPIVNLEWMSLSSWALFLSSWAVFFALFLVLLLTMRSNKRFSFHTVLLFLQSAAFLLIHLKYARGVDQFVPFVILLCAFVFSELKVPLKTIHKLVAVVALACTIGINMYITVKTLGDHDRIDNAKCAVWLREHTLEGSEVFLTNYGAFPELFFYNQHNVYTFGHDPVFLKDHDERLFELYEGVLRMRIDPYPVIKEEFGADYVHIENLPQSRELYRYLESSPQKFVRVYQDGYAAVFRVVN